MPSQPKPPASIAEPRWLFQQIYGHSKFLSIGAATDIAQIVWNALLAEGHIQHSLGAPVLIIPLDSKPA
jgi:hypothetical protein